MKGTRKNSNSGAPASVEIVRTGATLDVTPTGKTDLTKVRARV